MTNVLITTTPTVENRPVREYLGIVSGDAFMDERRLKSSYYYRIGKITLLKYGIGNFDRHSHELLHSHGLLSKMGYSIPSNPKYPSNPKSISWQMAFTLWWDIASKLQRMSEEFWELKAEFHKAQKQAIREMAEEAAKLGANAVIGVKIDYKITGKFSGYFEGEGNFIYSYGGNLDLVGLKGSFGMDVKSVWVIATGTAVRW